ncbi:MAG: protein kinase [Thermoanaerobaculia bacterium]
MGAEELRPGDRLGSYEMIAPHSSGGMGSVYRARDLRLGRVVAIKVLAPSIADRHEAMIRLKREAETASSLSHPALVTIFDVGEAGDGQIFIAMEWIEGGNLSEWLARKHPVVEIAELLSQAADGLAAAHASGIVHRDVKPDNIMVSRQDYAKVIDFGLAKAVFVTTTPDTPTDVMTQQGMIAGTPLYMAPEQLRGQQLEPSCDVFAFGGVIQQALTGRAPFAAASQMETVARILHGQPDPLPAATDPRLAALVAGMLSNDPKARPSMKAVTAELRVVARGGEGPQPTERRVDSVPPMRRWPVALSLVVLVLLAGLAGVWLFHRSRDLPATTAPGVDRPADAQVAELYAKAKFFEGDQEWATKDQAIPLLEEVVRRDPQFRPALIQLAQQYGRKAFDHDPDRSWEQKAFLAADKILKADPRSPEANLVLAQLMWTKARDFPHERALLYVTTALQADPSSDVAHGIRANILLHVGLLDEALQDYVGLRSKYPADRDILMRIARTRLWHREYAEALRELREYAPDSYQIPIALLDLGRDDEARRFVEQRLANDRNGDIRSSYAVILAKRGDRREALAYIADTFRLGGASSHFHHALYGIACAYAQLGDAAKCVETLDRVSREGMPCYPLFASDPLLDPVRGTPQFRQFLADSHDAHEARKKTITAMLAPKPRE